MEETNCELCGSNERKIILTNCQDYLEKTPGKFTVVQCKRCKLFYLNPRPTMNELSSHYPSDYHAFQKPNLTKIKKRLTKLARFPFNGILKERFRYPTAQSHSFFKKVLIYLYFPFCRPVFRGVLEFRGNGRILDIGCGSGVYLWFLKNLGWQVHGQDISPQACQIAQSLGVWENQPWAHFLLVKKGLRRMIISSFCRLQKLMHFSDEIIATFQLSPEKLRQL